MHWHCATTLSKRVSRTVSTKRARCLTVESCLETYSIYGPVGRRVFFADGIDTKNYRNTKGQRMWFVVVSDKVEIWTSKQHVAYFLWSTKMCHQKEFHYDIIWVLTRFRPSPFLMQPLHCVYVLLNQQQQQVGGSDNMAHYHFQYAALCEFYKGLSLYLAPYKSQQRRCTDRRQC